MTTITKEVRDRLPAASLAKFRNLETQADELRSLGAGCTERLQALRKSLVKLGEQRATQRATAVRTEREKERLATLKEIDQEIAALTTDRERLIVRQDALKVRSHLAGGLLHSTVAWLNALPPHVELAEHPRNDRPGKAPEVTPDALEKRRRRIRELIADITQTDAAPYSSVDAKQRARAEIEQLAELGRPNVNPLIESREPIRWPDRTIGFVGLRDLNAPDGIALVAWLYRDALIAALDREIGESADDTNALTDAQRSERFKTLFADLLAVEREEESLIETANFDVDRRTDADPRAVLGLSIALPGPNRGLVHKEMVSFVDSFAMKFEPPVSTGRGLRAIDVTQTTTPKPSSAAG